MRSWVGDMTKRARSRLLGRSTKPRGGKSQWSTRRWRWRSSDTHCLTCDPESVPGAYLCEPGHLRPLWCRLERSLVVGYQGGALKDQRRENGPLLSSVLPGFIKFMIDSEGWRGQTLAQNQAAYRMFVECCGNHPVDGCQRKDLTKFYDLAPSAFPSIRRGLRRLPPVEVSAGPAISSRVPVDDATPAAVGDDRHDDLRLELHAGRRQHQAPAAALHKSS